MFCWMCKGELIATSDVCNRCQYCCDEHYQKATSPSGIVQFNATVPDHPVRMHTPSMRQKALKADDDDLISKPFRCIKPGCSRSAHGTTCSDCSGQHCLTCCVDIAMEKSKPGKIFGFPVVYDDSLPENVVKFQQSKSGHVSIPVQQLGQLGITSKQAAEAIQQMLQSGQIQPTTATNSKGEIVETSFVAVPAKSALQCENCDAVAPTHLHSPNEKDLRNRLCDQCCVALGGPANPCSKWSVSGVVEDHPKCSHGSVVPHSWTNHQNKKTNCPGPVLDSHGNQSRPGVVIRSVTLSEKKERVFALGEDDE